MTIPLNPMYTVSNVIERERRKDEQQVREQSIEGRTE